MALAPGTRLGPYEVTALIGEGGMGKVWRAHHTALKRDDALKVLPDAFASDADRLARFQREAQVLASLNHPNIAHVYGLEQSDGVQALVMELVEGPTLADRIAQGPIPVDEALPIAKQIAEALEAAHERDVIHRDLKPANVKVRLDGVVKVLDFGLAKALDSSSTAIDASHSPTIASPAMMSGVGIILGTAAYMSPEQARGKPVDRRTDIWAFGCVLYEMLTGKCTFAGDDVTAVLARVLEREPDFRALPAGTPGPVRRVLRRCLQKERRRRLADIADARLELEETDDEGAQAGQGQHRPVWRMLAVALVAAAIAAVATTMAFLRRPAPQPAETRLQAVTPPSDEFSSFAISPDGQMLVYQAAADGVVQLWIRPLSSEGAQPVPSSEGARFPFWSPDGRSMAFFAEGQLKRFNLTAESAQTVAEASSGVIFFSLGTPETKGIYLGSLDSPDTRLLARTNVSAAFASPNLILFVRDSALMAQRIDSSTFDVLSNPEMVAPRVAISSFVAASAVSGSTAGAIAYRVSAPTRQLIWMDRAGREIARLGDSDANQPGAMRLSRDGTRLTLFRSARANMDVWTMDTDRGALRRITSGAAWECCPSWSPDGNRLVFSTDSNAGLDISEISLDSAEEEVLLTSSGWKNVLDWSPDGRTILFTQLDRDETQARTNAHDLWALNRDDKTVRPVVQSDFDEDEAVFSPDGQWILYSSNETGRKEAYIQRFPGRGGKARVSTNGVAGTQTIAWRLDGREIHYLAADNRLMAVPFMAAAGHPGTPLPLFMLPAGSQFVASPDGERFLVSVIVEHAAPITVLLNWLDK
jgi:eukaryotic-like serine/threonine-protein kinase